MKNKPTDLEQEGAVRAVELGLLAPEFVDRLETRIAGVNRTYTFENRGAIPKQWMEFAPTMGASAWKANNSSFGVSWNHVPNCGFDYLTGLEIKEGAEPPADYTTVVFPAGRYAVFTYAGPVTTLPRTIDAIWTQWVPQSSLKLTLAPCVECYTSEFDPDTGMGGMSIWIGVELS